MNRFRITAITAVFLVAVGFATRAAAVERSGFTLALSLNGFGALPTGDLGEGHGPLGGGGGTFNIRDFLSESFALTFDGQFNVAFAEGRDLFMLFLGMSADYYPTDRLGVRMSLGYSRIGLYRNIPGGMISAQGPAVGLKLGVCYDVAQSDSFGLGLMVSLEASITPAATGEAPPDGVTPLMVSMDMEPSVVLGTLVGLKAHWY